MLKNRKKLWAGIGLMVSCLSVVATEKTVVQAAENPDHKAIRAAYAKSDAAANRKDVDGMMSIFARDVVAIAPDGKRLGWDAIRQQSAALFNAAESIQARNGVQKITLNGNKATVLTRNSATIVVRDAQGRRATMVVTERASDTWAKRSGKWLVTQTKSLAAHMTVNGKAVKF